MGLSGFIGRTGCGWLADRIGIRLSYSLLVALLILGFVSLIFGGEQRLHPPLFVTAVCIGLGLGVPTVLFSRELAERFDGVDFGRRLGLAYLGASLGGAAGAATPGALFESAGSYLPGFAGSAASAVLSLASIWLVSRPPRSTVGRAT